MNPEFNLEKAMANGGKCQTVDGKPARIIATDLIGKYPIVAAIKTDNGEECVETYTSKGFLLFDNKNTGCCLTNLPEKITGWINMYKSGCGHFYASRKLADELSHDDRLACIPVTFKEGEGL